jgi:signal transduction histidine kinase
VGTLALTSSRPAAFGRSARVGLVAAGVAFAAWAEINRLAAGWPLDWVVVDLVPGLAFLVAGAVAWARRPESRIGPVMIVTGFAWYSGTLAASRDPLVDRLGYGFQGYYDGLLPWLVLAYPSGRLSSRAARAVVGALFAVLLSRTVFRLFVFRMSTDYDFTIPAEADRYIADLTLRENGETLFGAVIAILMLAVLVLLIHRMLSETDLARRIAWPMTVAGLALASGVLVKFGALAMATTSPERFGAWALGDVVTSASGIGVAIAFAVGLVRGRLARQSVADLVLELGGAADRPALREVVAKALKDPTVELLYPDRGREGYLDAAGNARLIPAAGDTLRAATRIEAGGETLAVLVHDPAIGEQPELMRSVIAAVRLAIENERLAAEVRSQLADVRASRARIVAAGDEQRRRIERDLHDGAQQRLVTLALRLEMARAAASTTNGELKEALASAAGELDAAIRELRELARGLHPPALATDGLRAAVLALAERTPLRVDVDVVEGRFDEAVETAAYFVVAEALTNVVRYAAARTASVMVRRDADRLVLEVTDDGAGGADPGRGSGLRGLDDRVAALGGTFAVVSPPGRGTTVRAELPCG